MWDITGISHTSAFLLEAFGIIPYIIVGPVRTTSSNLARNNTDCSICISSFRCFLEQVVSWAVLNTFSYDRRSRFGTEQQLTRWPFRVHSNWNMVLTENNVEIVCKMIHWNIRITMFHRVQFKHSAKQDVFMVWIFSVITDASFSEEKPKGNAE